MDTPTLLPCPFCGGTASLDSSVGGLFVECDFCEARFPFVGYEDLPCQKAEAAAAAAWNQRSAMETPAIYSALVDLLSQVESCDGTAQIGIEKAQQAIAAWNQRSAWQPIETAPRDGTWVLLAGGECDLVEESRNKGRVVTGRWTTEFYHKPDGNWQFAYYDAGFYGEYKDPTHWQPLPSPPPITP